MKKKISVLISVVALCAGVASASTVDCRSAVPEPRIVLTFDGVVDLVSPARLGSTPPWATFAETWIVAPDAYDPAKLPVVGKEKIARHEATLTFTNGELTTKVQSPQTIDNHEVEVTIPGRLPGTVAQNRVPLTPGVPEPSDDNRCSLEWIADMDSLSPSAPLRREVIEETTDLLAFRLRLTDGAVVTKDFFKTGGGAICHIDIGVETRGLAKSFSVVLPIDPVQRKLVLTAKPLDGTAGPAVDWEFVLPEDRGQAEILVSNHPAYLQVADEDFRAHYALREGWDSHGAKPTLPSQVCVNLYPPEPPGDNAMCSPGDDGWP